MIKCLSDRVFQFGEGKQVVETKIGFCELPDWVEKDDYFKMVVENKLLRPFNGSETVLPEKIAASEERVKALDIEILTLEDKLKEVQGKGNDKVAALKVEIAELEARAASLKGRGQK